MASKHSITQTKLRKNAKGQYCTLRLEGCSGDPATTVLCHLPHPNRAGSRQDDWFAVFGCVECHDRIDGRTPHTIPLHIIENRMLKALYETLRIQLRDELIVIKD